MGHPLEQRVEAVRRLARGELRRFGVARWLTAALVALGAGMALDYLLRFHDRGLRTLLTVACLAAIVWAGRRYLLPSMSAAISRLEISLKLECYFPVLRDRLANALEFLAQPLDDHLAGSAALRRGVVIDAQALSEGLNFTEAIDRRPARKAIVWCAAAAAVLAVVFVIDAAVHLPAGRPMNSWLAAQRLALPWSDLEWPRENHLMVKQPVTKLARGAAFEIEVIDEFGAPLPADARIEYRGGGEDAEAQVTSEKLRGAAGAMTARREAVERSFAYRVDGGDDHTFPWTEVTVIEPPQVERLAIQLHFPEYIGWPVEKSMPAIRAWRGTRVDVSGTNAQSLRSATVCLESGARLPAVIGKDRKSFRLAADSEQPFVVEASGAYWIELETVDGIRGGSDARFEVRALEDQPPRVSIERPQGNVFVTPSAVVPFDLAVNDDLAIQRIDLRYMRSDQSEVGYQEVSFFDGPPAMAAPRDGAVAKGDVRALTHLWELAPLALAPGAQLTVFGVAGDYRPQEGMSSERKLSIVTPEEMLDRLAERQTVILNELARLLRLQLDARGQVEGVEVQWKHVAELQASEVDRLHGGELTQRQVKQGLSDEKEGVPAQVAAVIADLAVNQLDHPDTLRQMIDIQETLARLAVDPLPAIEREFTAALKEAQQAMDRATEELPVEAPAELRDGVARLGAGQARVIAELEALLGRLTRWDALRRQLRDLAQLRQDQALLGEQTLEIGRQTLARALRDLTPAERAELERLALAQGELARRFDNVLTGLEQAREQLAASDVAAAETIGDALATARSAAVGGEMRGAGQSVGENQIGQAAEQQEGVVAALDAMLDALTNRQDAELANLVEKLKAVEQALAELGARQAALSEQAKATAASSASDAEKREQLAAIAEQQQQVEAEAQRIAREMERLQAGNAARSMEDAAAAMRDAQSEAQAGAAQQAAEKAEKAKQALENAQQELAEQRAAAEQQLAEQAVDQLAEALTALGAGQRKILESTELLEAKRLENGAWTRAELGLLRELARAQEALQAEVAAAGEGLNAARVLQRTLALVGESMQGAAQGLSAQDAGAVTQEAERRALTRLTQLLEALRPEPPGESPAEEESSASQNQPPPEAPQQPPGEAARRLAELKMLKLLQVEVYDGTKVLEERKRRNGTLSPQEQQLLEQLSFEQGKLAELLTELTAPPPGEEKTE
jgi:hypothetical protein